MKKLIPFLVLLLGASGALAQGTVNFNNAQTDFPTAANRDVYFPDMTTGIGSTTWDGRGYIGTNFQARLLFGTDASSLQPAAYPATSPTRFFNVSSGSSLAGAWRGQTRTLTGFGPGSVVTLQVQAWESGPGLGRTFEEARDSGGTFLFGESAVFTYTVPAAGSLPTEFYMDNFRSFSLIVPEPSVIGLGIIGVGALFLLRRRKA